MRRCPYSPLSDKDPRVGRSLVAQLGGLAVVEVQRRGPVVDIIQHLPVILPPAPAPKPAVCAGDKATQPRERGVGLRDAPKRKFGEGGFERLR